MRRTVVLVLSLGSLVMASAAARAGTDFAVGVEIKGGKPTKCTVAAASVDAKDDGLKLTLATKGTAAAAGENLTLTMTDDTGAATATATIAKGDKGATLERGAYKGHTMTLADATGPLKADGCTHILEAPQQAAKEEPATTPIKLQASVLNQKALEFLASRKITDHESQGGVLGRRFRLYHLPDGTPAFPLPVHINEKDHVEIITVVPIGATVAVDVVACDKTPGYRIKGSYKDATAAAGKLQGLDDKKELAFALQSYPSQLQCAGTLTYKIETAAEQPIGNTTTSITIDPVYRFEWGVGYGFDFGRPQQLSLGDRPAASGTGTEKFIVASDDYTGAKPIITLGVDVCGTNPSEMSWCDRLLMPSIWLDPTRLKEGFGVGLVFRPIFGVGILVGMSVFESTELAHGVGAMPGDTWTAAGDLPTRKVFNKDSLGLMLAATLDTEVFAALVP
jgi:hypothetical protein